MKNLFRCFSLAICMMCIIAFASPFVLHATELDSFESVVYNSSTTGSEDSGDGDAGAISDYLTGYTPVTQENMDNASTIAGPIASAIGTFVGGIFIVVEAAIFLVTALDLLYIGVPVTRSYLAPQQQQGGMGMGMGMGGMGMGGQPAQPAPRQWVSDEALACVALANPSQGGSPMGGMGGMGMGGMGMGGMGMGGQQPQAQSTKSVILTYLKKRSFFLVIFTVAGIVLLSSIFTDCGINLANLLVKVMNKINYAIGNVEI